MLAKVILVEKTGKEYELAKENDTFSAVDEIVVIAVVMVVTVIVMVLTVDFVNI